MAVKRNTEARTPPPLPRLDIKAPLALGLAAILAFCIGLGAAAITGVDHGTGFTGIVVVEPRVTAVSHAKGGIAARVHVAEGAAVGAGDLLISLDTTALDETIRVLKARAEAAARQIADLKQETASVAGAARHEAADGPKVRTLGRSVAELEAQAAELLARIAQAELALAQSAIRAPATGRVRALAVHGPGAAIAPGASMLDIVSAGQRLVLDGNLPARHIAAVKPGMRADVRLGESSWLAPRPLAARLAWVATEVVEGPHGAAAYPVRIELDGAGAQAALRAAGDAGTPAHIRVVMGERTLLAALLDPLARNIRLLRT